MRSSWGLRGEGELIALIGRVKLCPWGHAQLHNLVTDWFQLQGGYVMYAVCAIARTKIELCGSFGDWIQSVAICMLRDLSSN